MSSKTKDKIMEVAGQLFSERGFDGVSVRDIIQEAKANLGAVTYHFGTKDALFAQVLMKKIEPMRKMGEKLAENRGNPEETLRKMFETYAFHILHTDPGLKVFFAEILHGATRLPEEMAQSVNWRNKLFKDVLREGMDTRVFRRVDVECAAWSFFGMLSSYILYEPLLRGKERHGAYDEVYVRRIVNSALDIFLNGIKTRSNGAKPDKPVKTEKTRR